MIVPINGDTRTPRRRQLPVQAAPVARTPSAAARIGGSGVEASWGFWDVIKKGADVLL